MVSQKDKADMFHGLHHNDVPFIMPNPWDAGSARMLTDMGFKALATTSAGFAFTLGRQEGSLTRDEVMAHSRMLTAAVDVPVSADLEDCYAVDLDGIQATIQCAADAGLVGGSIEDANRSDIDPIYAFDEAVDRVQAAAEAAQALPFNFTLTARAENYLFGRPDLDSTIKRLQAFQDAGADVLFAPGLPGEEEIRAIISSVDRPVNVLVRSGKTTLADLTEWGASRISIGSALYRRAFRAAVIGAEEMRSSGTFTFTQDTMDFDSLNDLFGNKG